MTYDPIPLILGGKEQAWRRFLVKIRTLFTKIRTGILIAPPEADGRVEKNRHGGTDGTRTRDLHSDSVAF
jgi:hypothetical protein